MARAADPAALVGELSAAGLSVLATTGAAELDLDAAGADGILDLPTAWLFGSEAHGLPDDVVALADESVRVPIYGRAESLNLASAAAICLYASASAQRRAARLADRRAVVADRQPRDRSGDAAVRATAEPCGAAQRQPYRCRSLASTAANAAGRPGGLPPHAAGVQPEHPVDVHPGRTAGRVPCPAPIGTNSASPWCDLDVSCTAR